MPTPDLSLLIYCRDDSPGSRWVGQDALLSEFQCDQNIFTLANVSQWLLDNYQTTVSLASISQPTQSTILFTFTDSSTQGPFDLPTAVFTDRGDWAIDTPYVVNDTLTAPDGGLYRVTFNHTSSHTSFDAAANDGMGHDYYAPMIPPRGNVFPTGGAVGMYLRKNSSTDYDFNSAFIRATEVVFAASTDSALVSTNIADAIEEVERLIPTSFDSSDISYTPTSWLTSTNVGDALGELADINALHVVYTASTDSTLISTNVSDAVVELEIRIANLFSTAAAATLGALTDPGADRILIWDDSAGAYVNADLNGALDISGTTIRAIETLGVALSDETTSITTGTNKATLSLPYAFHITAVYATLNTVSSSGLPTVDINEAGTTILSTKLTIDVSEKTSATAATAAVISDPDIAANAEIGFDIDTAGTGAKGLKVFIQGYRP